MDFTQQDWELLGYTGGTCTPMEGGLRCTFPAEDGDVVMRCYPLFPGIALVYKDVHARSCLFHRDTPPHVFEIHHCREGRMEGSAGEDLFYMGPGDLSVCQPKNGAHSSNYPLQHYHGITVIIDVDRAPRCLSCFLEDVDVEPGNLMKKFCADGGIFIARSRPFIAHVFAELYSVPEEIRAGYLKVKVLELMLFLTAMDADSDELSHRCFTPSQKLLAQQVSAYLSRHMDRRITLEELAEKFHVSGTQIKSSIRGVYGTSLYAMIRGQKMQDAARLLLTTDLTILEIAGRYGYDNASKFAAAFKAVLGGHAQPVPHCTHGTGQYFRRINCLNGA